MEVVHKVMALSFAVLRVDVAAKIQRLKKL